MTAFRKHGPSALESKRGRAPGLRALKESPAREHVIALKREHEEWGTRRIRDVLKRFETLGVSEQVVRRILHEEGLIRDSESEAGAGASAAAVRARDTEPAVAVGHLHVSPAPCRAVVRVRVHG